MCFLPLVVGASVALAATPKRVLLLHSFGHDVAPFSVAASAFRTELARGLGQPVDLQEAALEQGRFAEPAMEQAFADFLQRRFTGRPPDLVVPVGAPAGVFAGKHRPQIFPDSPILFTAADSRLLRPEWLATNATLVAQQIHLPGLIEDILQLEPNTTNVVVVLGASPLEKFWEQEMQREFQPLTNRLTFSWTSRLAFDQLRDYVSGLSPRSFVLYTLCTMDGAGVPYGNEDCLRRLHQCSKAPIYGFFRSQLGLGTVGGRLYQDATVGALAASVAVRILRGEPASRIPPQMVEPPCSQYDARELQRWGIPRRRLPPGSEVLFRQPTLWRLYRWRIVGVVGLCLGEAALIAYLLANRVRRRRAEQTARFLSGQLIKVQEEERARLARELHDDVTQRLARLAIDVGRVEREAENPVQRQVMREVREGVVELSHDIHALSYRLHPSVLEDLGLTEALKVEVERFIRWESLAVELKLREPAVPVPRETALCLFRVAQEAMRNVARHARARELVVSLGDLEDGIQLAVQDDGCGFDWTQHLSRPSLGLASMRERVRLCGGELEIESAPGQGTTILAWVPAKQVIS